MTGLHDYLKQSAARDADGSWDWSANPDIPILSPYNMDDWLGKHHLKKDKLKLISVSGWYSSTNVTPGEQYGIQKNPAVKKLVYTNATAHGGLKEPSWFVSPESGENAIHPGDEFILQDYTIESGGTLRDLIKHINLRGGIVRAIVHSLSLHETYNHNLFDYPLSRQKTIEELELTLYGIEHHRPELLQWNVQLPEAEKKAILLQEETIANEYLRPCGLALNQLTYYEADWLCNQSSELKDGATAQQFWEKQTARFTAFPPPIEKVENLQALSHMLGTEFQAKWTDEAKPEHQLIKKFPNGSGRNA